MNEEIKQPTELIKGKAKKQNKTNEQKNNGTDGEVTYSQPYGDTAMVFKWQGRQVIVQFNDISYDADTLKRIIISNGILFRQTYYCFL